MALTRVNFDYYFNSYRHTTKVEYRDTAELIPSNLRKKQKQNFKIGKALKLIFLKFFLTYFKGFLFFFGD